MPPQSINRNRVTATPRRKSLGLGSLLGGGVSGGEFIPGDAGYTPSPAELEEAFAFMDETPVAVNPTPGSFNPVTVNRPVMDAIFGRGQAAAQASGINAQQQMALAQMEAQQQAAIMSSRAAMEREMYGQGEANRRIPMQGEEARKTAAYTSDVGNNAKVGLSSASPFTQFDAARSAIEARQLEAQARAQRGIGYDKAVRGNTMAVLNAPAAENFRKTLVTANPNERVMNPFGMTGQEPGRMYNFPGVDISEKSEPVMMEVGGKMYPTDKNKTSRTVVPREGGYTDDIQAQLKAKADENKALAASLDKQKPAVSAAPASVSSAPARPVLTPQQLGAGYGQGAGGVKAMPANTLGNMLRTSPVRVSNDMASGTGIGSPKAEMLPGGKEEVARKIAQLVQQDIATQGTNSDAIRAQIVMMMRGLPPGYLDVEQIYALMAAQAQQ